MITSNKLRIAFFALMYIVFISLWADSLYEQEKAQEIIAEQEAFIAEHQILTIKHEMLMAEFDELLQVYDKLEYKHDSLVQIDQVKSEYVNGFGYKIDWVKAVGLTLNN